MIRGFVSVVLGTVSQFAVAVDCHPKLLPPRALELVRPLLELRTQQANDEFTTDGHWIAESSVTPLVEKRFEALLANRSPVGDEVLAYLLNVYMGEHAGEELVCEITNRGKRMVPLIKKYQQCTPLTGLEPLHKFVRGSGSLPGMALHSIASGQSCQNDG
jgi:hypothetical protein